MARISTDTSEAISLGRIDTSSAYNEGPQVLNTVANQVSGLANKVQDLQQQKQEIEQQKQDALATVDMNKSHAEMAEELQGLQLDTEKQFADDPKAAEQDFNSKATDIKARYDDRFAYNDKYGATFSNVSEDLFGQSKLHFDSWKSAQEVTNAAKGFRTTQFTQVRMAGNANNLAELDKIFIEAETDYQTAKGILGGPNFDMEDDNRKHKHEMTTSFLDGQLDRSPGSVDNYLKDPSIATNLSQDEMLSYKKQSYSEIQRLKDVEEKKHDMETVVAYYDFSSGIINGTVTIGQLNSYIDNLKKSGRPPEVVKLFLGLRDSQFRSDKAEVQAYERQLATEARQAKQQEKMQLNAEARTTLQNQKNYDAMLEANRKLLAEQERKTKSGAALIDVTTRYNALFYKDGKHIEGAAPLKETAKLLGDINRNERAGLLTNMDGFKKALIKSVDLSLQKDKPYQTKKQAGADGKSNFFNDIMGNDVPADQYNANIKGILDASKRDYKSNTDGLVNASGESVKAIALGDYFANYERYKSMGMSDKDITAQVYYAAQRTQRGDVQKSVDNWYNIQKANKELRNSVGGMTYYAKSYIPSLSVKLGVGLKVTSTYRPNDKGSLHSTKQAVDVSMSEHNMQQRIKFFKSELDNPQVKYIGTSDPHILGAVGLAGSPKLHDFRAHDMASGDNHVNHAHVVLTKGDPMGVAPKAKVSVPAAAIEELKRSPGTAGYFDKIFGVGASKQYLKGG